RRCRDYVAAAAAPLAARRRAGRTAGAAARMHSRRDGGGSAAERARMKSAAERWYPLRRLPQKHGGAHAMPLSYWTLQSWLSAATLWTLAIASFPVKVTVPPPSNPSCSQPFAVWPIVTLPSL